MKKRFHALLAFALMLTLASSVLPRQAAADTVTLSLKSETADGSGAFTRLSGATGVFVSGNYAYVASQYDNSLSIIDVSNPTSPVLKSQVYDGDGEFSRLDGAWSVYVSGNYAYVAAINEGVTIMDISNPLDPVKKSEVYDGDGEFTRLNCPTSVFVSGNYAYVASMCDQSLTIMDVSDPTNPVLKSEVYDGDGEFTKLFGASSVYVSGNYAYVASYDDHSLTIMDISNPLDPVKKSEVYDGDGEFTKLDRARSVFVSGNYAYVASEQDNSLTTMDVSDPTNPVLKSEVWDSDGEFERLREANGVFVSGNYAYVTGSYDNGVTVMDISDPTNPAKKTEVWDGDGTFTKLDYPYGIFVSGNYVYVVSFDPNVVGGASSLTIMEATMSAGTQTSTGGSQVRLPYVQTVYMGNDLTSGGVSVIWTTDISSYSQIEYGTSSGQYPQKTVLNDALASFHTMTLSGLAPDTKYYFRVIAGGALDQKAYSSEYSFTTKSDPTSTTPPLQTSEGSYIGAPAVASPIQPVATSSPTVADNTATSTSNPLPTDDNATSTPPAQEPPAQTPEKPTPPATPELPIVPAVLPPQAQAATASPVFNRDLEIGTSGEDTRALQEFLAQDPLLYPERLVTGFFGALTQKAVERFQKRYEIVPATATEAPGLGRVGPITRAKLNELVQTANATWSPPPFVSVGTSTPPGFLFTRTLNIGGTGADVVALQQILIAKGFLVLNAKTTLGYFGGLTRAAVIALQKSIGLESVGVVGPKTRAALNQMTGAR